MKRFLSWPFKKGVQFFSSIIFALANVPMVIVLAKYTNRFIKPRSDISVTVHGHKMYASTMDRIIALFLWKFSALEDHEIRLMQQIIKKGMVVVDVGANIGYYTLQMARLVGVSGKVYAIEPDSDNCRLLIRGIRTNSYNNVVVIPKAVSSNRKGARLFICEEHKGDHRIFDSKDGRKSVRVETMMLDDILSEEDRIDVIKMDIQGAEYFAFEGMKELIKRNPKLILVSEFAPYLLKKAGISADQFLDRVIDYGFDLKFINEKNNCIESVSKESLIAMCGRNGYVNLYLEK